jgi:hypothetical protein
MIRDQQIRRIKHTMLDRMERIVAVIARRYPPPAYHRICPKAACRRARKCHAGDCRRAGTGARNDACVGRMRAQTGQHRRDNKCRDKNRTRGSG